MAGDRDKSSARSFPDTHACVALGVHDLIGEILLRISSGIGNHMTQRAVSHWNHAPWLFTPT